MGCVQQLPGADPEHLNSAAGALLTLADNRSDFITQIWARDFISSPYPLVLGQPGSICFTNLHIYFLNMAEKTNSAIVLVVKVFNSSILKTIASARKPVGSLYALLMAEILVFYFFFPFMYWQSQKRSEGSWKEFWKGCSPYGFQKPRKAFMCTWT